MDLDRYKILGSFLIVQLIRDDHSQILGGVVLEEAAATVVPLADRMVVAVVEGASRIGCATCLEEGQAVETRWTHLIGFSDLF